MAKKQPLRNKRRQAEDSEPEAPEDSNSKETDTPTNIVENMTTSSSDEQPGQGFPTTGKVTQVIKRRKHTTKVSEGENSDGSDTPRYQDCTENVILDSD